MMTGNKSPECRMVVADKMSADPKKYAKKSPKSRQYSPYFTIARKLVSTARQHTQPLRTCMRVFDTKTGHHARSPAVFARFSFVRLHSIPETQNIT